MATEVLPAGAAGSDAYSVFSSLSTHVPRAIEPVGPQYLAHARRVLRGRTWSEDERIQALTAVKQVEEEADDEEEEEEDPALLTRDPKDWKSQDHYQVLGLSKFRYRATDEQIRRAHRKKVLKHHPDKRAQAGSTEDDAFFKCIQKAMEILSDPVRRRQFDSVDEEADVLPPSRKSKGDFYKQWSAVFDSEGRFSKKQPVPLFGDVKATKQEVDAFYSFFYNFDSWRTFEYLDEDIPDDSDNRDHKRYIERKNRAARQKRKTEDTARLRKLVDDCLSLDPRMKMFKEAEKKAKEQRKWEREADSRKAAEDAKKKKEEEERLRKEEEERAKADKTNSKKAKEAAKNAKKKNKRAIKAAVQDVNYFTGDGATASAAQTTAALDDADLIMDKLDDSELASFASKLADKSAIQTAFEEIAKDLIAAGKVASFKVIKL
ncbi:DnaJ domain-containing protein [Lipomyces oligophaga]|uniref:DnaJ domain-containing protein n=1 Tax=Lipomyces oligophaga TaxID=45792 RepID=UPI0034CFFA69